MAGLNGIERRVAKLAEGRDGRVPAHEEWVQVLDVEDPAQAAAEMAEAYPVTRTAGYQSALRALA